MNRHTSPRLNRRLFLHSSLLATSLWLSLAWDHNGQAGAIAEQTGESFSETTQSLVNSNIAFALDVYQCLAQESENLFFSPYSISAALAMTFAGARGITETEMAEVLHFSLEQDQLHPTFAELRSRLEIPATDDYQLLIANKLWGQVDFPFSQIFLDLLQTHYGADLEAVEFSTNPEAAREAINTWVAQQTNEKIQDLLPTGIVDSTTLLVLVNAIYFLAKWSTPFNPAKTTEEPFFTAPDETVMVPMMKQAENFYLGHVQLEEVELLELPYGQSDHHPQQSMIIILPQQIEDLAKIEQQLTPSLLAEWLTALDYSLGQDCASVWLPKFSIESDFNLKHTLVDLGMNSAFSEQSADFAGMDNGRRLLSLQETIHKAVLNVNESGTEAAAATAVVGGTRGGGFLPIVVDRPFLLLIYDRPSDTILFMGRVVNPLS
ncbi:MAG: serpin family protein [Leptolyngbyaceae cyanobacterium]